MSEGWKSLSGGAHPLAAALVLAGTVLLITARFWHFDFDDGYITYRIAENIAGGQGWVYNPGERVNGATSVLWTFLLACAAWLAGDARLPAHIFGTVAFLGSAWLLWLIVRERLSPPAAGATSLLFLTQPLLLTAFGLETHLYLLCALLAVWSQAVNRPLVLGISLGLAILTRPDGILLAVILLGHRLLRDRRVPWLPVAVILGLLFPWATFSVGYFGRLAPNTLAAKVAQGRSGLWRLDAPWPFSELPLFTKGVGYWAVTVYAHPTRFRILVILLLLSLTIIGLLTIRRWSPGMILIAVWGAAHLAAYSMLGVPFYHWYYAPCALWLAVTLGAALEYLGGRSQPFHPLLHPAVIVLGAVPLLLSQGLFNYLLTAELPRPRELAYEAVGRWLEDHAPPGASVAAAEIGVVGYFSRRKMIDMTAIIDIRGPREIARGNWGWWLEARRPDFVVAHDPPWLFESPAIHGSGRPGRYEVIKEFASPGYGKLMLLRYSPD